MYDYLSPYYYDNKGILNTNQKERSKVIDVVNRVTTYVHYYCPKERNNRQSLSF